MCSNAHFHTLVYYKQKTFASKSQFSIVNDNRNFVIEYMKYIEEVWSFFSDMTSLGVCL